MNTTHLNFFFAAHASHFDAELGANEQRMEPYFRYGERAVEFVTTLSAKNAGGVVGFAGKQASVVRSMT